MEKAVVSVPFERKQEPEQQRSTVRFAIILVSCFTAFAVAYCLFRRSDALTPFLAFNASLTSSVVNLFPINTGRIISLLYIGEAFPGFLDTAHLSIWQFLLILITVGLGVFWAAKMVRT